MTTTALICYVHSNGIRPSLWLRNKGTKDLINTLQKEGKNPLAEAQICASETVATTRGKDATTHGCMELVYSFGMWISPEVHLLQ